MIPLSDQEQYLKSRIDHPAGRHRYRGPHGDDHRVGHARAERDAAPGDALNEAIGLVICIAGLSVLGALAFTVGWHLFGVLGAVAAGFPTIWIIHLAINHLEEHS